MGDTACGKVSKKVGGISHNAGLSGIVWDPFFVGNEMAAQGRHDKVVIGWAGLLSVLNMNQFTLSSSLP